MPQPHPFEPFTPARAPGPSVETAPPQAPLPPPASYRPSDTLDGARTHTTSVTAPVGTALSHPPSPLAHALAQEHCALVRVYATHHDLIQARNRQDTTPDLIEQAERAREQAVAEFGVAIEHRDQIFNRTRSQSVAAFKREQSQARAQATAAPQTHDLAPVIVRERLFLREFGLGGHAFESTRHQVNALLPRPGETNPARIRARLDAALTRFPQPYPAHSEIGLIPVVPRGFQDIDDPTLAHTASSTKPGIRRGSDTNNSSLTLPLTQDADRTTRVQRGLHILNEFAREQQQHNNESQRAFAATRHATDNSSSSSALLATPAAVPRENLPPAQVQGDVHPGANHSSRRAEPRRRAEQTATRPDNRVTSTSLPPASRRISSTPQERHRGQSR